MVLSAGIHGLIGTKANSQSFIATSTSDDGTRKQKDLIFHRITHSALATLACVSANSFIGQIRLEESSAMSSKDLDMANVAFRQLPRCGFSASSPKVLETTGVAVRHTGIEVRGFCSGLECSWEDRRGCWLGLLKEPSCLTRPPSIVPHYSDITPT